eukprot:scaffold11005_cov25-Tisochrysis_lutea.AAC.3
MATASESFVDFPDAAVIPSLLAQAFQQVREAAECESCFVALGSIARAHWPLPGRFLCHGPH